MLELKKVPMKIHKWSLQGVFLLLNDSTWFHDSCFHLFKESLCSTIDNLITCIHPRGNKNNGHRASLSLKLGDMKISATQCEHCKSR